MIPSISPAFAFYKLFFTTCFHPAYIFNLRLSFFKSSYVILINRDGHHSSTSNRHAERAKTSCSAPTQSRSPSAHRSRSVSAALRQAGSPVKSLTQSPRILRILAFTSKNFLLFCHAEECSAPPCRPPCSRQTLAALV